MSLFQTPPQNMELVKIPAGEFVMGIDTGESPESPAHRVYLEDYYIGKYPVTNAQYLNFLLDTGHSLPSTWINGAYPANRADHPVSGITWADADMFCAWLRYKTGKPFHLPTEAQWEKAATWNPQKNQKTHFPWGNAFQPERCNLMLKEGGESKPASIAHGLFVHGPIVNLNMHIAAGEVGTTPVGHYSPSGDSVYGCADLIGNVEEWCHSVMWQYPYQANDGREEQALSGQRCIRGGNWFTFIPQSGIRRSGPSDAWLHLWGLRVAMSYEVETARRSFRENLDAQVSPKREIFRTVIQSDPNSAQLYYDWGSNLFPILNYRIDRYLGEMEQFFSRAIELYEKSRTGAIRLSTENPLTTPPNYLYFNRALVRGRLENFAGAYTDMSQALSLDDKDADGYLMRAEYACEIKNPAQMERDLQKAQELRPKPSYVRTVLEARLLEANGKWEEANHAYTEMIIHNLFDSHPYPKIYLWRANTFRQLGNQERAISDYYHYFLLHPENTKVAGTIQRARQWYAEQNRKN